MSKGILMTATVLSALLVSSHALAGTSANVSVVSDYLSRGITQTMEKPALQAGLDYTADNGLYVGTWASNSKFADDMGNELSGPEIDLYAGYKKDLKGGVGFDMGVAKYFYPDDNSIEFAEAYAKASLKGVDAEIDYTIESNNTVGAGKKGDWYYALGYTGEFSNGVEYGAKIGRTDYDDSSAADYTHYQLSLTKSFEKIGEAVLAVDDSNLADTNPTVSIGFKRTFDF